jgi:hypothetical protein
LPSPILVKIPETVESGIESAIEICAPVKRTRRTSAPGDAATSGWHGRRQAHTLG